MKLIDYDHIHKRFFEWRGVYLPTDGTILCIGSKGQEKGVNVEINPKNSPDVVGDAKKLPVKTKAFDYAFMFEVLEHFENPNLALLELKRVTKKTVILSIPGMRKTVIHKDKVGKPDHEDYHKYEYSPKDFKKLAEAAGFTVAWRKRFHALWFSKLWPWDMIGGLHRAFDLYKLDNTEKD
ncbi:MAG: class I SAM-dependent methyltransferase [Candidatus Hodarchaeales archaeon]|jgi:ubiquinone/menaquinone biosynthesis C-methylase UbiE